MEKKEIYNLVILDKSGSMENIRTQAVDGVNETAAAIRKIQEKTGMKQFLTVTAFCGCECKDLCHNVLIDFFRPVAPADYTPCCMTPLHDAIGRCCTRLEKEVADREDVAVSVTIITDGYENASKEWSPAAIRQLIGRLKEKGWLFAYIGANQDVEKVKCSMAIDNAMAFDADAQGTKTMFTKACASRSRWAVKVKGCPSPSALKDINTGYFEDPLPEDLKKYGL